MKIGRYASLGYSRRTPVPEKVAPAKEPYIPKRKALLIGINYGGADAGTGYSELKGPHADVAAMRKLLLSRYNYAESDIVVLLDSEDAAVPPTRANILRAIDDLVRGARKGDRFFFHYCGHTTQIENRSNSEEDGMDECLVPVDGEENKILDNELRRHLVAALPVGSSLVAVFDSCHSASLLDLVHFRCNRVYVPWLSKGRRRSDDRWNAIVRRHALPLLPLSKPPTPVHSPPRSRSNSRADIRSPPLSRSNTHASAVRSPLGNSSLPFPPQQSNAATAGKLQRKAPTRKATRRATREMRELMQLLEGTPPMPIPEDEVPGASTTGIKTTGHATHEEPELEPTRPNTPLATSPEHAMYSPPLVTTRRIYEATRTSKGRLRAWRTEVDALEVEYLEGPGSGDGEVEVVAEVGGEGVKPLSRAGTEVDMRVRKGRQKHKRKQEQEQEQEATGRAKRTSLPLVPLRLGSFSLGTGRPGAQEDAAPEDGNVKVADAKAKGKGKERRTTVSRARAVSVIVREGSGSASTASAPGKENIVAGKRPTLTVAVPRDQAARPASWLGEGENRECESPAPVWPCTGWACRDRAHGHDGEDHADVISLASCKDYQLSWEDSNGGSMTQELVKILEHDPHPTLRSLVTNVSHALHRMSLGRHLETRRYKSDLKKYEQFLERQRANAALLRPGSSGSAKGGVDTQTTTSRVSTLSPSTPGEATASVSRTSSRAAVATVFAEEKEAANIVIVSQPKPPQARSKSESLVDVPTYDMNNFQDPQVASHRPLNMERLWEM